MTSNILNNLNNMFSTQSKNDMFSTQSKNDNIINKKINIVNKIDKNEDNKVIYFFIKEKISLISVHECLFFVDENDNIHDVIWYTDQLNNAFVWKRSKEGDKIKLIIKKDDIIYKTYENMTRTIKPELRILSNCGSKLE